MNGTQFDPALSENVPILIDALSHSPMTGILVVATFLLLIYTSTKVVKKALDSAGLEAPSENDETTEEDTGTVIGKTENVLVLALMLVEAYTALGVIFAAKSIVRKSDMDQQDTSYYLTGTLANFTYSVTVALLLHVVLWGIVKFDYLVVMGLLPHVAIWGIVEFDLVERFAPEIR